MMKRIFLLLFFIVIINCNFGEKEKSVENKNEKKII